MAEKLFNSEWSNENAIYVVLLVVVFLLGIVPIGWYYLQSLDDLSVTQKQLRKAEVYNHLATSVLETKHNEYDAARKNVGEFFCLLQTEAEKGDDGFLTANQIADLKPIFENRDLVIEKLDRRDQISLNQLTEIYSAYIKTVGKNALDADSSNFGNSRKLILQKSF